MDKFDNVGESIEIVKYLMHRYYRDVLSVVIFYGGGGRGKSYGSMRLGELLSFQIGYDCNFDETNVVDNLLDLLRFVKTHVHCVLVCEEASVLFSNRRFMGNENVTMNKIIDTLRKRKIILILNYPVLKSVDTHLLQSACLAIQCLQIYKSKGVCLVKPIILQPDPYTGKIYRHHIMDEKGDIDVCIFRKPSDKLIKAYEKNKDLFINKLYLDLEAKHQVALNKEKPTTLILKKELTPIEQDVSKLINEGITNQKEIAKKLNLSQPRINAILKNIRKKSFLNKIEKEVK